MGTFDDVTRHIGTTCMKWWRIVFRVFVIKKKSHKLKVQFYRVVIEPSFLYEARVGQSVDICYGVKDVEMNM